MVLSKRQIARFQEKILDWYAENKRNLPWRPPSHFISLKLREDGLPDPYYILVSEVMLQQTQVSRVIPKYEEWFKEFPTIAVLAKANTREVLTLWSGLGYNRRALYLQKTAKQIMEKHNGVFPKDIASLKKLPGIGEYTAGAIACFAFDEQVAVVDTNVRRVILTQFPISNSKCPMSNRELQIIADQLLPKGVLRLRSGRLLKTNASEWNQALMDYAACVLKKEKIPIVKQSRFVGSDRYYRGRVVKILLHKHSLPLGDLGRMIKEDFSPQDLLWLRKIIDKMIKEKIILEKKNRVLLKS